MENMAFCLASSSWPMQLAMVSPSKAVESLERQRRTMALARAPVTAAGQADCRLCLVFRLSVHWRGYFGKRDFLGKASQNS